MGIEEVTAADPASQAVELGLVDQRTWTDFAAAWAPLHDRLFRIAFLVARGQADAEDAVADAMAATYAPWRSGRVESLDAYARRALVNRLTDRGRRRVITERHLRRRTGDGRGAPTVADEATDRTAMRQALLGLSPRQRAVVVLRFYGQLSVTETAAALGCAEGTVKSQTHDALRALRAQLSAAEEEHG